MTRFQKLAVATAVVGYLLIILGGVVRIVGSGAACAPDWLACGGQSIPSFDVLTGLEYAHRVVAGIVALLTLGLVVAGWRAGHISRVLVTVPIIAFLLVLFQAGLGVISVIDRLPSNVVTGYLAMAEAYVALTVIIVLFAFSDRITAAIGQPLGSRLSGLGRTTLVAALSVYALLVTGAYTATSGAANSCKDWPQCGGHYFPTGWTNVDIDLTHRWIALIATVAVIAVAIQARRVRSDSPTLVAMASAAAVLMAAQIFVGAASIWFELNPAVSVAHLAVATILWGLLVATVVVDRMVPVGAAGKARLYSFRQIGEDYVTLTKPGVMTLLLFTTFCAMLVAASGFPSIRVFLWTLLGGALSSGGAAALNHYMDRDIDGLMYRTRRRPIPSGRMAPVKVAIFGVTLSILAVYVLAVFVNPLAALLSLSGNLFYVFIYTKWLKRATPQNIVIGGAAGSIPPLVGWAAVTNNVGLTALIMFAVIFLWTPPHFWALALFKQGDYGAAGVPMMPNVRGEEETRKQITIYTVVLVASSLLLYPLHLMGTFYLVVAFLSGGWFVVKAIQLGRTRSNKAARSLFFYSMWYLAIIFLAMVVDRALLPMIHLPF